MSIAEAIELHRSGKLDKAETLYRQILRAVPDHFDALRLLGALLAQRGSLAEAERLLSRAIRIKPRVAEIHSHYGNVVRALGRLDDALASYATALALQPDHPDALNNRGVTLHDLGRFAEAMSSFDAAISERPAFAAAYNNRGNCQRAMGRRDAALADYERAIAIEPNYAEALNNRAVVLDEMGEYDAALAGYDRALAIKPDYAEALNNRGVVLHGLHRADEALQNLRKAIDLQPGYADALNNRGAALLALGRYKPAIADFEQALRSNGKAAFAKGMLHYARQQRCAWHSHAREGEAIVAGVRNAEPVATPFAFLGVADEPDLQLACAEIWVREKVNRPSRPVWGGERYTHERIRLAYLSADFHASATMHLMAGLFEQHDRQRFETVAISFGPDTDDPMRQRIRTAFDAFVDVRAMSDRDVAVLLHEREIDIAVDLMGHTSGARPGILAARPCPIQVGYLGYPGTSGAGYLDYLIADRFVIPADQQAHYSEKVVALPDTFQANDSKRRIGRTPSRAEAGLPDRGFVFCSFNATFKINPAMFDIWMRLLRGVDDAVLWLLAADAEVEGNFRREAAARGVPSHRIRFAPRVAHEDYLARYRLCDLFLDTLPFNAGTTASDALWAGVPLLTCSGKSFAARMAGSLLNALGMPELVTTRAGDYEARALEIARNPNRLAHFKNRVAEQRIASPLFDTARFRRNVEAAYVQMCVRHQRGLGPEGFNVSTDTGG